MESHDTVPQDLPKIGRGALILLGVVVVVLFAGAFIARFIPNRMHQRELDQQAQDAANAPPIVNVVAPKMQAADFDLTLPGDAKAFQQTAIYSRVDGFVKKWYFDIDSHVEAGQLLAEIDAPDTDAQLSEARAALLQAQANVKTASSNSELATATYERYHGLLASGSVTQQDLDTRQSTDTQAKANLAASGAAVKSAEATVQRLEAQAGFERIVAPFSGTISLRNYDVGARISSTDTAPGHELFDIAQIDELRIFANVPQGYASLIKPRQEVGFEISNYPGKRFVGHVARSAGVIDPVTRTLYTELDFDNKQNLLWAGMYGTVHINVHDPRPALTVPTPAMIFRGSDTLLAIVDDSNKIHFQKVQIGQDLGTQLQVVDGLATNARVVSNPGEKLVEGIEVQTGGGEAKKAPAIADASHDQSDSSTRPSRVAQTDLGPADSGPGGGGNK